jgi:hypothetical protein
LRRENAIESYYRNIYYLLYRNIQNFLVEKYGLYYQIHVIEECGINGAILALVQDCYHRVIGSGKDLNLPENNTKNLFLFHFSKKI